MDFFLILEHKMTTILQLSALYEDKSLLPEGCRIIDFRGLDGTCRYCSPESAQFIRKGIADLPPEGIHFIDTGDYHYLSLFWMEKIKEPFILALFDNHPDDQPGAFDFGMLSCGNWVLTARGTLPLMKSDVRNCSEIPGDLPVYLSIDIDVLSTEYARTNWSQGDMTLPELLGHIGRIFKTHRVIGADICGGLTAAADRNLHLLNEKLQRELHAYLSSQPELSE